MLNDANRVKEIFLEAAEQPDEAARSAYLDRVCADDAGLRERIEALLRSHDPAGSFLGSPAVKPMDLDGATQELGVDQNATPDEDANGAEDLQFLSPSTRPDSLGRIGHYEMLQVLGKGGFGIVFRAFDETLQRVVAVKVMAPQIATLSPARKRFVREARSSAAVRHENVVHVYEVGEQPLPYLVMEFVPGETLQQKLDRSGPLDVSEVLRTGRQIAEGLAAAHASDLIHRDIKPANILLEGGSQKVKITDFGLARAADDASISQSGVIAGTPMFMAPEQALGREIDQRADLFSLGSVLYQMVSGRPPFRAPTALAVLKRVTEETPRPIPEIIPETPAWLCEIIAKLHAKNPNERYQSAREIADVLADCEAQLKAHAKIKDFSRIPRGKPRRSGRWKWVAAAAVLLLPLVALAVTEFAGVTYLFRGRPAAVTVIPKDDPKAEPKTPVATGRFALAFDGKNSLVRIPSLRITEAHAFTVEAWAVLEQPAASKQQTRDLISNLSREGGFVLNAGGYFGTSPSFLICLKNNPAAYAAAVGKQPVPRNQLTHFAGVYDGKKWIRFYVNGQSQNTGPASEIKPSTRQLTLGNNTEGTSGFLGRMNEVRISKVARYDSNFTPARRWEPDPDTLALYHFDEGEGAVLTDSSGNGHRGHIEEATWVKADESPISPPAAAQTPAVAPFTDADVQRIAALPAAEQVEEVRKELMRRNPGFDGTLTPTIDNGVVTGLQFLTGDVDDISPVRALTSLQTLRCNGSGGRQGQLTDLSPLKGMPLTELHCDYTKVSDLSPLKGMPLTVLNCGVTKVSDLSPLKDMKLTYLSCGMDAPVSDLSPLKGMPLTKLYCDYTKVSDLSPLRGMPLTILDWDYTKVSDLTPLKGLPLEHISLTPKNVTEGLEILRDMKSLKTIGIDRSQSWPAAEFWERYDKGEFKE